MSGSGLAGIPQYIHIGWKLLVRQEAATLFELIIPVNKYLTSKIASFRGIEA